MFASSADQTLFLGFFSRNFQGAYDEINRVC
jgi:hypothetical protein